MNRADLFNLVRVQIVFSSGAGPLAAEATRRICAGIDEYSDNIRTPAHDETVPKDIVRQLVEGLQEDLGSLARE